MAVNIPTGFMQVAFRFTLASDAEIMITTVGVDHGGDPITVVDQLASQFASQYAAGSINTGWAWIGIRALVGVTGGPPTLAENTTTVVGTGAAPGLPSNCAYLIRKNSALGGRAGRGRMYLPPFVGSEGSVDQSGILAGGTQDAIQDNVDAIFAGIDAVILHDVLSPVATPTPVTQFVVDRQIATQRRRMRR